MRGGVYILINIGMCRSFYIASITDMGRGVCTESIRRKGRGYYCLLLRIKSLTLTLRMYVVGWTNGPCHIRI
jgi:hypothetical protein